MGKEVQSDKLPIFDSQKSTKTTIKLLKISQFKAFKVDQAFCNTLYVAVLLITIILYHLVVLLTYLLNDQIENETTCFLQPSKTDRITL